MNSMLRKSISILGLCVCSVFAQADQDSGLLLDPVMSYFGTVQLGGQSTRPVTMTLSNFSNSAVAVNEVALNGVNASEFTLASSTCGANLAANSSCEITVNYKPVTFGSHSARVDVLTDSASSPKLSAFVSNEEDRANEVQRRMPPLMLSTDLSAVVSVNADKTVNWQVLGYHEDYASYMAVFKCEAPVSATCGESYNDANRVFSSLDTVNGNQSLSSTVMPQWSFFGEAASAFDFQAVIPASLTSTLMAGDVLVARFYFKALEDIEAGEQSISLVVPGALGDGVEAVEFFDTQGRRLKLTAQ